MGRKAPTWAIHTNIGRDPRQMAAMLERERISAMFEEDSARADRAAEVLPSGAPNQCPDIVEIGSEADVNNEFSFKNEGWSELDQRLYEQKQLREALDYGNVQPAQFLTEQGVFRGRKMRNETMLGAVAVGKVCWKCGDAQPQDRHVREERHRRLADAMPMYSIPSHLTVDDCCCTCGAILGLTETSVA